ncbi:hypothetical protein [Corynebacterium lubricantis]|uniref:hypothetical protein n=1 Tax=Corynebacterium lubricantis TaxID=541095 RepID=UPI00036AFA20|nr:hypothetical protein [Corynebacterium lubricantis]
MDQLIQALTQASLWIQLPLVLLVVLPIAGVVAVVLLRIIDAVGVGFSAAFRGRAEKEVR